MRKRNVGRIVMVVVTVFAVAGVAEAGFWNRKKRAHADKNNDGRIGPKEYQTEKRFERKVRSKVNTPREAKLDANNDGRVQPAEVRAGKADAYLNNRSTVNTKWEAKADANGDGTVDGKELQRHHRTLIDANADGKIQPGERKAYWVKRRSKVTTAYEKSHDADGDGWISGEEARDMLRDRLRVINTHGRAKVNTAIEREFDGNGDGVIDKVEAEALRDAINDE